MSLRSSDCSAGGRTRTRRSGWRATSGRRCARGCRARSCCSSGAAPRARSWHLQGPDVEVAGSVLLEIAPYLARARVATAPLRAGGGSRLKILEALDAGRPVVATTIGAEGLEDLVGSGVVLADTPAAMAAKILELLRDRARAERLGRAGHAAVQERYSWDVTLRPLLDFVDAHNADLR